MKRILSLFSLLIAINVYAQPYDTIQVSAGWNLIGALQAGAAVQIINTIPSGIISSSFFGFTPGGGYQVSDTLRLGKGYWIKVSEPGKIVIGATLPFVCGTSQVLYMGKFYNTIQIGSQCWLKENLDIGTMILNNQNSANNGVIEKYCWGNDPANCNSFGGLYQWDEAMQYSTVPGTKGICPSGWHIPALTEIQALAAAVSGIGNSLKSVGQGAVAGAGTNTSGFSAFLAGGREPVFGDFNNIGIGTNFWDSSEDNSTIAGNLYLNSSTSNISIGGSNKLSGFSVRCLKD